MVVDRRRRGGENGGKNFDENGGKEDMVGKWREKSFVEKIIMAGTKKLSEKEMAGSPPPHHRNNRTMKVKDRP